MTSFEDKVGQMQVKALLGKFRGHNSQYLHDCTAQWTLHTVHCISAFYCFPFCKLQQGVWKYIHKKVIHGLGSIKSVDGWMEVKWPRGKYQAAKLQVTGAPVACEKHQPFPRIKMKDEELDKDQR